MLCVPSLVALAAGGVGGYVLDSVTAVVLVLPVTVVAHAITLRWAGKVAAGAFFGMLVGVLLRGIAIVGGAAVLMFGTDWYKTQYLWVWLIGVYLSTLAVETVLLGRALRRSPGVPLRGDSMADQVTPEKGEIDPFKEVVDAGKFEFSESWNDMHGLHFELPNLGGPFDNMYGYVGFQITKFQILLTVAAFMVAVLLIWLGRKMKNGETPRGWVWNSFEGLYFFVRDKIARAGMGHDGDKYTPFLTTLFLFILITNLLGMIPFLGSATASIAVTFSLAMIAFMVIHVSGIKENGFGVYMKSFVPHFHMEGGPAMKAFGVGLTIGMAILEYATVFIRLVVLAIRLFANMLAGHTALFMILFFIELVARPIHEGGGYLHPNNLPEWLYFPVAVFSVVMATLLSMLEIFVAGLQAFIFTLLTSIFIGLAKHPAH